MASAVEQAIAEIDQQLVALAPVHEGLRDYYKVNLKPDTGRVVGDEIVVYDRREKLLFAARAALESLVEDGHPGIPPTAVTPDVFADLQDNKDTITAAFGTFTPQAVVSLGLTAGSTEPK